MYTTVMRLCCTDSSDDVMMLIITGAMTKTILMRVTITIAMPTIKTSILTTI